MRHTNYILSTIATLALLAGCNKPETASVTPLASDEPIVFKATPQTKGNPEISTLERLAKQDFSVSAWYTPEGETFGIGSTLYLDNRRFGTLETEVQSPLVPDYDHALWQGITGSGSTKAATPAYYPLDGTLTFFCYAPYQEDVTDASDVYLIPNPDAAITSQLTNYIPGSPLIRFQPEASSVNQIDFIAATPLLDVNRASGAIPLDFTRHITTRIEFWCKYTGYVDPLTEGVKITQIVLRDVIGSEYLYFTETSGTLGHAWCSTISPVDGSPDMPTATYTLSVGDNALISEDAYLDNSTAKWVNNTINGIIYVLPQTLPAGAYMDVTYQVVNRSSASILDENTVSIPLNGTTAWPIGKVVRYTLTVSVPPRNDVTLSAEVVDWTDAHNNQGPQELMY